MYLIPMMSATSVKCNEESNQLEEWPKVTDLQWLKTFPKSVLLTINVMWTMKCLQNLMCSPRCELAVIAGPGENCWKRRGGEEIDRDRWGRAAKWKGEFDHGGKYLQSRWVNEKEEKTQVFARTKWSSRMQMRQWPLSYFIRELNSRRTFYLCPDQHVFRCCLWRRGEGEGAEERGVGVEKEISEVKIYSKSLRKCIWKKRKGQ